MRPGCSTVGLVWQAADCDLLRTQDDVLFTKDGPVVLTANCPKEVVDVEGACQGLLRP